LNCIDRDGTNSGFDIEPINHIRDNVTIPVTASSGAGRVEHFSEVFEKIKAEAALTAGIFHWEEVSIQSVKDHLRERGIKIRYTIFSVFQYNNKGPSLKWEGPLLLEIAMLFTF
jgi:glutamine amidotransferase/cyclase